MDKIGDFSKKVGIPASTLRYYDEIGLLKPGYTDQFSNYRYYTDSEYDTALIIKYLQGLKFTLEEIIQFQSGDEQTVVDNKIIEIQNSIKEYMQNLKELGKDKTQTEGKNKVYSLNNSTKKVA